MQTLKLSLSLPDAAHPNMQVHVSSQGTNCDVVIELPESSKESIMHAPDIPMTEEDEYVLGGYAGI